MNRADFEAALRTPTADPGARQALLNAYEKMLQGATKAGKTLAAAQQANIALMKDPSSLNRARRAQLATTAYEARVSSDVGRMQAAYALMADREGQDLARLRNAVAASTDKATVSQLVERSRGANLRRNIMLQAAAAAEKAFDAAPALPMSVMGRAMQNNDIAVNFTNAWRPPSWVARANTFFPTDIQAAAGAAGSLGGFDDESSTPAGWFEGVLGCCRDGTSKVTQRATELAEKVTDQLPGTMGLAQQARAVAVELQGLQDRLMQEAATEPVGPIAAVSKPWGMILAGGAAAYLIWRMTR